MNTLTFDIGSRSKAHNLPWTQTNEWTHIKMGQINVGIRDADGYITIYETNQTAIKLHVRPDDIIIFFGNVVPLREYDSIPFRFRLVLESAFPWLITRTDISKFEPDPKHDYLRPSLQGELIPHKLSGVTVYQRASDGYVNATAMCQAAGKLIGNWSQNLETKKVLAALSSVIGIPINEIVVSKVGGNIPPEHRGTWVHPKLALHLANWCSPDFYASVIDWTVDEWTAGNTMTNPKIDYNDPVVMCERYLEAEKARRKGLALIETAAAEKEHAIACRDEAPMDG